MSDRTMERLNQPRHYKSGWRMLIRTIAQCALLRPIIWTVLRVKVEGAENLRDIKVGKPFIVVANHASHLDMPLLVCLLPTRHARRLATAAANDYWFTAFLPRKFSRALLNTFPVDRKGEKQYGGLAARLLGEGVPLAIFPEGKRSRTGRLGEFHSGSARLAIENGVLILPIALRGAGQAWPPGRSVFYILRQRRPRVDATIGKAIQPTGMTVDELNKKLKTAISTNLKK